MGSKFALVLVLAKLLEPSEVGLYGQFTATIGFCTLVIGGDYYTYSQRELLSEPKHRWSFILQHQAIATALLYAVLLPAQLLVFFFDLLPWRWATLFLSLLVSEHLAQEVNRILISMHRQLIASSVLFIRTGIWAWCILPIMWLSSAFRTLQTVIVAWLIGSILATIVGLFVIRKEVKHWQYWSIDWAWLKKGFTVGLLFLTATICFRALQTFDRFAVKFLSGDDALGVYVLYSGMAMAVISALDPSVFSFLFPKLVAAHRKNDQVLYKKLMTELAWSAIITSLVLSITIALLAPCVLDWVGKSIYTEQSHLLWLLLTVSVAYAIGMIPHYGLYAYSGDKSIVFAHISSLAIFIISLAITSPFYPFEATACSLIAAFVWMGLFKHWQYRKIIQKGECSRSQTSR